MYKLLTAVFILSVLSASPAFAGRDSGGNGDSQTLQAGDEFADKREINKRDRCVDDAHTTDEARRCVMNNGEEQQF